MNKKSSMNPSSDRGLIIDQARFHVTFENQKINTIKTTIYLNR
jgi:hypothetical protein